MQYQIVSSDGRRGTSLLTSSQKRPVVGNRNLKFAAVLQVNSRARAFANKASSSTETAIRNVLREAEKLAKQNVAEGKGPGPHPHPDRKDTGNLAESIQSAVWL